MHKTDQNLLRVEHSGADDEFEDVLEGFECPQDGFTGLSSTGHVQIFLQHGHQLPTAHRKRQREFVCVHEVL